MAERGIGDLGPAERLSPEMKHHIISMDSLSRRGLELAFEDFEKRLKGHPGKKAFDGEPLSTLQFGDIRQLDSGRTPYRHKWLESAHPDRAGIIPGLVARIQELEGLSPRNHELERATIQIASELMVGQGVMDVRVVTDHIYMEDSLVGFTRRGYVTPLGGTDFCFVSGFRYIDGQWWIIDQEGRSLFFVPFSSIKDVAALKDCLEIESAQVENIDDITVTLNGRAVAKATVKKNGTSAEISNFKIISPKIRQYESDDVIHRLTDWLIESGQEYVEALVDDYDINSFVRLGFVPKLQKNERGQKVLGKYIAAEVANKRVL